MVQQLQTCPVRGKAYRKKFFPHCMWHEVQPWLCTIRGRHIEKKNFLTLYVPWKKHRYFLILLPKEEDWCIKRPQILGNKYFWGSAIQGRGKKGPLTTKSSRWYHRPNNHIETRPISNKFMRKRPMPEASRMTSLMMKKIWENTCPHT